MVKKKPSRKKELSLRKLTNGELLNLRDRLDRQCIQDTHQQAKQFLKRNRQWDRGSIPLAPSPMLEQVLSEIDRRAKRGEFDDIIARRLRSDFRKVKQPEFQKALERDILLKRDIVPSVGMAQLQPEPKTAKSGATAGKQQTQLRPREQTIWDVIQRGLKGLQYCRELEAAGIRPKRVGSWKGSPSTYPAAYQAGEPYRHRVQDEKSKIRRKGELANNSPASKS